MPGKLREALERWASEKFQPEGGAGWWERVKRRWNEYKALQVRAEARHKGLSFLLVFNLLSGHVWYALTGQRGALLLVQSLAGEEPVDLSSEIADMLRQMTGNKTVTEIAEILGALITEPVLALLEREITNPSKDPKDFARAFHGMMIGLNTVGGLVDTALETVTGGQVEGAGRLFQSMYWSLGLGFLGWQTLAPLLESGLQPGLDRYYKRMARPARFSPGDLRDLHALGVISADQLREAARDLGWREEDIEKWISLAYRVLSQGEVFEALHQGYITQDEAVRRLRALGYDPRDIPLLMRLNPAPQEKAERDIAAGTARQAYREGLISAAELRDLLRAAKYSPREIDLVIAIEDSRRRVNNRALTVSQIKNAWDENVITTPEARHWLTEAGFDAQEIDILLATWQAQAEPPYRKLNIGTIIAAYVNGVINRDQTRKRLLDIGLAPDDADLEIKLAEARNPEAFGGLPRLAARRLTAAQLADIFYADLITADQYKERLASLGYKPDDADLLTRAVIAAKTPAARELPQYSIERAYLAGVLNRAQAQAELVKIRLAPEAAEIVLNTLDREREDAERSGDAGKAKYLSPTVLEDLLIAGLIDADEMRRRLAEAGYDAESADLLTRRAVQLATPERRVLNQSMIERAYLAGVLDRQAVIDRLVAQDYPPDEAERIVATIERENPDVFSPGLVHSVRTPSIEALARALQNGIITEAEYLRRAVEIGYREEDARLYIAQAVTQERKAVKTLTQAQIANAYGKGFIPWAEALTRLTQLGYSEPDAVLILRMEREEVTHTEAWLQMLSGNLSAIDALAQLIAGGYRDDDIVAAFGSLSPVQLQTLGVTVDFIRNLLAEIPGGEK